MKFFLYGFYLGFFNIVFALLGSYLIEYETQRKGGLFNRQRFAIGILGGIIGQMTSMYLIATFF